MQLLKLPGAVIFALLLVVAAQFVGERMIQPETIAEHAYPPPEIAVVAAEGGPPYTVIDGKVDWGTYNGFRRYGGSCLQCHGPYGLGSTFAPALAESLKFLSYDDFLEVVINGRGVAQGARPGFVMPPLGDDPNVVMHLDDIYAYLKGRSDGAVPAILRLPHMPKPKKKPAEFFADVPLNELLAAADVASGRKLLIKCKACHIMEKGGTNKLGPPLWDIVGAKVARAEGFAYSEAMAVVGATGRYMAGVGATWSYELLDAYLADPRKFMPGTKMIFPGFRNPKNRAAAIAFLRSMSDDPKPLP